MCVHGGWNKLGKGRVKILSRFSQKTMENGKNTRKKTIFTKGLILTNEYLSI